MEHDIKYTTASPSNIGIDGTVRNSNGGLKEMFIEGKPKTMFQLLDHTFVEGIADVLTMGARKYKRDNWKLVDRDEYERAIYHHMNEYLKGNKKDGESGESHLYHIACNAMFLDWFDRNQIKETTTNGLN